jgi:hypothetical protein
MRVHRERTPGRWGAYAGTPGSVRRDAGERTPRRRERPSGLLRAFASPPAAPAGLLEVSGVRLEVVRCAAQSVQCAARSVQCAARSVRCAARRVRCAARSVQCAARSVPCAARSVPCVARRAGAVTGKNEAVTPILSAPPHPHRAGTARPPRPQHLHRRPSLRCRGAAPNRTPLEASCPSRLDPMLRASAN